jgi:hypothetical protein
MLSDAWERQEFAVAIGEESEDSGEESEENDTNSSSSESDEGALTVLGNITTGGGNTKKGLSVSSLPLVVENLDLVRAQERSHRDHGVPEPPVGTSKHSTACGVVRGTQSARSLTPVRAYTSTH